MAIISLVKVTLFGCSAVYLVVASPNNRTKTLLQQLWMPRVLLCAIAAFSLSLLWTQAASGFALVAFLKHAKLLGVVLLLVLIRDQREARLGLNCLLLGQVFALLSSWLMAADVPLFWAVRPSGHLEGNPSSGHTGADGQYVPFAESYLDQSIMFALSATVAWHLHHGSRARRVAALFFVVAAVLNIFLLMQGRTAYVVVLACAVLALYWQAPKRVRLWSMAVAPLCLIALLLLVSGPFHSRVAAVIDELVQYREVPGTDSSVGARLGMWHRSLLAIESRPLSGYGVGGWLIASKEVQQTEVGSTLGASSSGNPHQEFLLWGVELGAAGIVLLIGLLAATVKDASNFSEATRRCAVSVALVLGLTCLFNAPLYDDLLGDFICVTLALLSALGLHEGSSTVRVDRSDTK